MLKGLARKEQARVSKLRENIRVGISEKAQNNRGAGGNAPSLTLNFGKKMIGRCACAIAAMAFFSACMALGQDFAGAGAADETGPTAEPQLTSAENPDLRHPPFWQSPVANSHRLAFHHARAAALCSVASAPPPPSAPPASIAKPQDIAVVFDEAAKGSVKLHVGEATEGEKDSRIVVLSLPAPGETASSSPALVSNRFDQPDVRGDGRQRAQTGADWIFLAHAS